VNDLISANEISPITLPDGTELDARQTHAVMLRATSTLDIEDIAKQAGYSGRSTCSHFLRSNRGRAGLQVAIRQHLLDGARVGLQTMLNLATSARSENVRQLAAADLLDRAGYNSQEVQAASNDGSGREVNISINLNTSDTGIVIEGEAESLQQIPVSNEAGEGGRGKNDEAIP